MRYFLRVAVAIDQLGNALAGGLPDETISSRVGRNALAGNRLALVLERLIDGLFWIIRRERGHCRKRIEWDEVPKR